MKIKSFFRTCFCLILLGVLGTLAFQYFFPWSQSSSRESADGPAERVGEVLDRGISGLGKLTERAGKEMQKAANGEQPLVLDKTPVEKLDTHRR